MVRLDGKPKPQRQRQLEAVNFRGTRIRLVTSERDRRTVRSFRFKIMIRESASIRMRNIGDGEPRGGGDGRWYDKGVAADLLIWLLPSARETVDVWTHVDIVSPNECR